MQKQKLTWSVTARKVIDLTKNGYNPRKLSESERRDLEKSIKEFGAVVPIVLNIGSRTNIIIGGEQRLKIYADLGIAEVECMIPSRELTLEEEKELNLRLNKNTGSWNEELLKEFDMDMLLDVGFGDEELQNLFDDVDMAEDDFDLDKAIKETPIAKVKSGEIYELGKHRLLVGDSTDEDQVKKLIQDDLADIVWMDPPYNISWDYGGKYNGSYKDNKSEEEYSEFISKSMETAKKFAKPDSHFFYWSDPNSIGLSQSLYDKHGIKKRRVCLWIKSNQNCTPKIAWNRLYEPCTYGTVNEPYLNPNFRNANEILNQEVTTGNQVLDELQDMIDLWLVKRDNTQSYLHPTQKPVTLNEKPFKRCSAPGHIIFSGFAGSGSDLIACEQLNRVWRGVEKDLVFATIIIDRWEKFTNLKAKKIYESK
ncbi:MAG TPA: DNA methyltransferase [Candidatus Paceibacterota bacterium]|nr:DNA methyltransferase [Candidatus Paceibacterota bacterium]